MAAVVLEDFYKPFFKEPLSEKHTSWLMKSVVVILGALSLGKFLFINNPTCDSVST